MNHWDSSSELQLASLLRNSEGKKLQRPTVEGASFPGRLQLSSVDSNSDGSSQHPRWIGWFYGVVIVGMLLAHADSAVFGHFSRLKDC